MIFFLCGWIGKTNSIVLDVIGVVKVDDRGKKIVRGNLFVYVVK